MTNPMDVVSFLDDDDFIHKDKPSYMRKMFLNSNIMAVSHLWSCFGNPFAKDDAIYSVNDISEIISIPRRDIPEHWAISMRIGVLELFFSSECVEQCLVDGQYSLFTDLYLCAFAFDYIDININKVLYYYRITRVGKD